MPSILCREIFSDLTVLCSIKILRAVFVKFIKYHV